MKTGMIAFLVLCAVFGCILIAGCTGTPTEPVSPTPTPAPTSTPAVTEPVTTVSVEKFGLGIPANDFIQITLPGNPTTGYEWVVESVPGLIVNTTYVQTPGTENMTGAGGNYVYLISAEKAGTYTFTAAYVRPWENVTPLWTMTQKLTFGDLTAEPSTEPSLSLTFAGTVNPAAGELVKVTTAGNPTTGYVWNVTNVTTVKVVNESYVQDTMPEGALPPIVGMGGTYEWLVTADAPGTYQFGAAYARSWEDAPVSTFWFDLTFV